MDDLKFSKLVKNAFRPAMASPPSCVPVDAVGWTNIVKFMCMCDLQAETGDRLVLAKGNMAIR